jgi:electron transport complex protein RnfB
VNTRPDGPALVDAIDALLPQTQCRKCGYAGCRPYAEALAAGAAQPNQCAPGGHEGAAALAGLLGVEAQPVDPRFGVPGPAMVALIDESRCIGCTLCIQACPMDAIVGAAKLMHTVIAAACTGCELCVPPCPVDCIALLPNVSEVVHTEHIAPDVARRRFDAHNARAARMEADRAAKVAERRERDLQRRKRETIEKVMEKAKERLAARTSITNERWKT